MKAILRIDGVEYDPEFPERIPDTSPLHTDLIDALLCWKRGDDLVLRTSGSTGVPKTIKHSHRNAVHSAQATAQFFVLPPGSTALLSLPLDKVAGRMMLYRALVNGWHLTIDHPRATPLDALDEAVDFAAMTPYQVMRTLNDCPQTLRKARTLLVGGAPVRKKLIDALHGRANHVFETYGMTETLTHIAVKRIYPEPQSAFQCLPGIEVSAAADGTLIIGGERFATPISTTDLAEVLAPDRFVWLGRSDFTINSGGVKIQPEPLENLISDLFNRRFILGSRKHKTLGEQVVLVIEGLPLAKKEEDELLKSIKKRIEKYAVPKKIEYRLQFLTTSNGKIKRPQP